MNLNDYSPMLSLDGVVAGYGVTTCLKGVSLRVERR